MPASKAASRGLVQNQAMVARAKQHIQQTEVIHGKVIASTPLPRPNDDKFSNVVLRRNAL